MFKTYELSFAREVRRTCPTARVAFLGESVVVLCPPRVIAVQVQGRVPLLLDVLRKTRAMAPESPRESGPLMQAIAEAALASEATSGLVEWPRGEWQEVPALRYGDPAHGQDGLLPKKWFEDHVQGVCQACGRTEGSCKVETDVRRKGGFCISRTLDAWVRPGFVRFEVSGLGPVQLGVARNALGTWTELGRYTLLDAHARDVETTLWTIEPDGSLRMDADAIYRVPATVVAAACELAGVPVNAFVGDR